MMWPWCGHTYMTTLSWCYTKNSKFPYDQPYEPECHIFSARMTINLVVYIHMSKSICDHHMTNVLSPICPIHHLTIIWPTHFWSKHMTNHTTKIVISTNLIMCSGLNIKCQRFILHDIYLWLVCHPWSLLSYCCSPPLYIGPIGTSPTPPPCWCSRFTPHLIFCQLLLPFSSPLH